MGPVTQRNRLVMRLRARNAEEAEDMLQNRLIIFAVCIDVSLLVGLFLMR